LAAALAGVLPRDHGATELQRTDGVGHHQDGPARSQQNHVGIGKFMPVGPSMPWSENNEIRRSGLARYEFVRQFKRGAPFNLLEMLPFGAEPPAHVIEACAHRSALTCRGLVIDNNASSGKSGP